MNNELAHHGVKGMEWGVRKLRDGATGPSNKGSSAPSRKERRTEAYRQKLAKKATRNQEDVPR